MGNNRYKHLLHFNKLEIAYFETIRSIIKRDNNGRQINNKALSEMIKFMAE